MLKKSEKLQLEVLWKTEKRKLINIATRHFFIVIGVVIMTTIALIVALIIAIIIGYNIYKIIFNITTYDTRIMVEAENEFLLNYYWLSSDEASLEIVKEKGRAFLRPYEYKYIFSNSIASNYFEEYLLGIELKGVVYFSANILDRDPKYNFPKNIAPGGAELFFLCHPKFDCEEYIVDEKNYIVKNQSRYISFNNSYSFNDAMEMLSGLEQYGYITWLWVDTYTYIEEKEDLKGVYGIPLFYSGETVADPLNEFLYRVNKANESKYHVESLIYNEVKLGIKNDGTDIEEGDVRIIGAVFLPFESDFDNDIIGELEFVNVVMN